MSEELERRVRHLEHHVAALTWQVQRWSESPAAAAALAAKERRHELQDEVERLQRELEVVREQRRILQEGTITLDDQRSSFREYMGMLEAERNRLKAEVARLEALIDAVPTRQLFAIPGMSWLEALQRENLQRANREPSAFYAAVELVREDLRAQQPRTEVAEEPPSA